MSQQAGAQTILTHTSQLYIGADLLLPQTASELERYISPWTPSSKDRSFAWRSTEDDADHPATWSSPLCFCRRNHGRARVGCLLIATASLSYIDALQAGVSVKRHLSRIFPPHPRSLASVLVPRPAARRCSASPCVRPAGLGFQRKNLPAAAAQITGEIFSSEPPQKAHLGTWERGTSRRFAQECPEGNPGKYKQGETPWHSTKTKSL